MGKSLKFCCPCLFGLESVLSAEIKAIGGEGVVADNGKVSFFGDESMIAKANLWLRTAERVLLVMGEFQARTFEALFEGVREIDFSKYIKSDYAFTVTGWSLNSDLSSVPACQSIIKKAAVKSLSEVYNISWFEESGPLVQIRFSIMKNAVSIYLDTSGTPLHKRGYRANSNEAPIKETLAAGIVSLARLYDDSNVYDPFCGSGTLVIEAALKALNIAPGINRHFAFEKWLDGGSALLTSERKKAVAEVKRDAEFKAFAFDIDPECVRLTMENARKAGVASKIKAEVRDVREFHIPTERGVVITNPPYGERLLDIQKANELYKIMGEVFEKRNRLSYYVISPSEEFEQHFGAKADRKRKLYNGMIKCDLFMYFRNQKKED